MQNSLQYKHFSKFFFTFERTCISFSSPFRCKRRKDRSLRCNQSVIDTDHQCTCQYLTTKSMESENLANNIIVPIRLVRSFEYRNIQHVAYKDISRSMLGKEFLEMILNGNIYFLCNIPSQILYHQLLLVILLVLILILWDT